MRSSVALEGMGAANQAIIAEIRGRTRKAIAVGGEGLKQDLRAMTGAALGDRLAKTWRLKLYGQNGSESPAAFVWTKAPRIIAGNMRGGTIVAVHGARYLAIPTDRVPRRMGRGGKARMSPEEVEAHFNQDLILKKGRKPGTLLGFIEAISARSRRRPGLRNVTKGRLRQGRKVQLVLMFTFVRSVRQRKTIDPDAAFARWGARTRQMLQQGV